MSLGIFVVFDILLDSAAAYAISRRAPKITRLSGPIRPSDPKRIALYWGQDPPTCYLVSYSCAFLLSSPNARSLHPYILLYQIRKAVWSGLQIIWQRYFRIRRLRELL